MSTPTVADTARYPTEAADIYAAFQTMPNSSAHADNWNAMQAVRQALNGRTGMRVVDLGCGSGGRTRQISALPGVVASLGVDHSPEQLALARSGPNPANCEYAFGDLVALGNGEHDGPADDVAAVLGTFDVALMEFVSCHAGTQQDLNAMIRAASAFLARGVAEKLFF